MDLFEQSIPQGGFLALAGSSGCAMAGDPFRAGRQALVDVALEGCGAGLAEDEAAEAVGCGVAVPASGAGADGAGARLAGKGDRAARGCLRGRLAVEHPLEPGEACVVAAGLVDAGEGVLGDKAGLGTLLADLLTPEEELCRANVFDVRLLASRLTGITRWLRRHPAARGLPVGYFGASTGAAAGIVGGCRRPAGAGRGGFLPRRPARPGRAAARLGAGAYAAHRRR